MSLPIEAIQEELLRYAHQPHWLVAYSGGLDSTVLLHLLSETVKQHSLPPLAALHINHQISDYAESWQLHCARFCAGLDIEFHAEKVVLPDTGTGLEAAARKARYRAFARYLQEAGALFQGHHLDDQVETFFLRLMRGTGLAGLEGIPRQRALSGGVLLRPLLDCPRRDLQSYAELQGLEWIEDDSNADVSLDRNYLRHQVMPLLEARWPTYRGRIQTSIDSISEAQIQLSEIDRQNLRNAVGEQYGEQTLRWDRYGSLDHAQQRRSVRAWLNCQGCAMPDRSLLIEFLRQLADGGTGSQPQMQTSQYTVRFFDDQLYLSINASAVASDPLPDPQLRTVAGRGISKARAGVLRIASRQGGERCRPAGRCRSQSLKKLLQEYRVPPWLRDGLPLVFNEHNELVAVADLWVCEGFQAGPDEPGWELVWSLGALASSRFDVEGRGDIW